MTTRKSDQAGRPQGQAGQPPASPAPQRGARTDLAAEQQFFGDDRPNPEASTPGEPTDYRETAAAGNAPQDQAATVPSTNPPTRPGFEPGGPGYNPDEGKQAEWPDEGPQAKPDDPDQVDESDDQGAEPDEGDDQGGEDETVNLYEPAASANPSASRQPPKPDEEPQPDEPEQREPRQAGEMDEPENEKERDERRRRVAKTISAGGAKVVASDGEKELVQFAAVEVSGIGWRPHMGKSMLTDNVPLKVGDARTAVAVRGFALLDADDEQVAWSPLIQPVLIQPNTTVEIRDSIAF